jgi:hypothetical protein
MIDDAETKMCTEAAVLFELKTWVPFCILSYFTDFCCDLIYVDIYLATMSGILIQTVGQCKMQICGHHENSNLCFTFH